MANSISPDEHKRRTFANWVREQLGLGIVHVPYAEKAELQSVIGGDTLKDLVGGSIGSIQGMGMYQPQDDLAKARKELEEQMRQMAGMVNAAINPPIQGDLFGYGAHQQQQIADSFRNFIRGYGKPESMTHPLKGTITKVNNPANADKHAMVDILLELTSLGVTDLKMGSSAGGWTVECQLPAATARTGRGVHTPPRTTFHGATLEEALMETQFMVNLYVASKAIAQPQPAQTVGAAMAGLADQGVNATYVIPGNEVSYNGYSGSVIRAGTAERMLCTGEILDKDGNVLAVLAPGGGSPQATQLMTTSYAQVSARSGRHGVGFRNGLLSDPFKPFKKGGGLLDL